MTLSIQYESAVREDWYTVKRIRCLGTDSDVEDATFQTWQEARKRALMCRLVEYEKGMAPIVHAMYDHDGKEVTE